MAEEENSPLETARVQAEAALAAERPAKLSRTLSHILDDLVGIPGTPVRIGVDPLLTLIPWAGTASGAIMGSALMIDAVRLRMPVPVLARMLGNWTIDWLVGMVPYAGVVMDALWRSNVKNLKLVNRTIDDRAQVYDASVAYWIAAVAILVSMVVLLVAVPALLTVWLVTRS